MRLAFYIDNSGPVKVIRVRCSPMESPSRHLLRYTMPVHVLLSIRLRSISKIRIARRSSIPTLSS